jgi:hypothetical protein
MPPVIKLRLMKNSLLSFFLVLFSATVFGQAPQQMNYQAVARDAAGNPLPNNTTVSVRFQIHDGTASGTVVFQETTTAITNKFGLITHAIGETGNLTAVNWGSGPKYLQVEYDPTGGANYTDMGTTQLLSVPYALYAANAPAGAGVTGRTGRGGGTFRYNWTYRSHRCHGPARDSRNNRCYRGYGCSRKCRTNRSNGTTR